MLPELGHFALILALYVAVLQVALPAAGFFYRSMPLKNSAIYMAYGQTFFLLLSMAMLAVSFLTNDFSVAYVAANSNTHLPAIYRFCAIWGAHEGSLLLWIVLFSVWMSAFTYCSRRLDQDMITRVLIVLGVVSVGFLLFVLFTSNPFLRLLPHFPLEGRDLNALLQDPGLVSHPPMLYMGYVGFSLVFAFAIAALWKGTLETTWLRTMRPWTLLAWCFLTLGIVLGSWWSYRELGWGGWWFWDPVENASLMPWLTGTALVHSLAATEQRKVFQAWTVLLAIITFSLSLLGTFLVRSGVLVSVHAFASDPSRGRYLLFFLAAIIGSSLFVYAWRAAALRSKETFTLWSRELFLLLNNLILTVMMLTVLLGTLYPLLIDALGYGKLSVGPPYFNTVMLPLVACLVFAMGVGPLLKWRKTPLKTLLVHILIATVIALLGLAILYILHSPKYLAVWLGVGLSGWCVGSCVQAVVKLGKKRVLKWGRLSRAHYGMIAAHLGIAVMTLGITFSSAYSRSTEVAMSPGDHTVLQGTDYELVRVNGEQGPNYITNIATVVARDAHHNVITVLKPQQRFYTAQKMALSKVAMDVSLFRDLYVALGQEVRKNSWSFRLYYKPFIRWIWWGGVLMVCGGLLACSDRRYRKKKRATQ